MTWLLANTDLILTDLIAHLLQAVPAILGALLLSVPVARVAQRVRPLRVFLVSGSALLYAVPSLALFVIMPLLTGIVIRDPRNVVVVMALYGLALLVPVTVDALEAVDREVVDAAVAMGVSPLRRFFTVELPLAGAGILAGLRVVIVSTVSLTTVGAVLGVRSLGQLFTDGFQRGIPAEIAIGLVITVFLALVLDGVAVVAGRLAMPWTRVRAADGDAA